MICPICKATGFITVRAVAASKETHEDSKRPCPMGCAPVEDCGVGAGTLMGNEMSVDDIDKRPFSDYTGKGSDVIDWKKHYGFKED
jgi:hypothetical protein